MIGPHLEMIVVDATLGLVAPREEKLAQRVVVGGVLLDALHLGVPELLALALVGPIAFALGLAALDLLGGHHNHARVLLPDHVPEVRLRVGQAALRGDVRLKQLTLAVQQRAGRGAAAGGRRRWRRRCVAAVLLQQHGQTAVERRSCRRVAGGRWRTRTGARGRGVRRR